MELMRIFVLQSRMVCLIQTFLSRFGGGTPDETTLVNKKMIQNNKKFLRELQCGIPLYILVHVRKNKTTKEMWNALKEMYEGTDKKRSTVTNKMVKNHWMRSTRGIVYLVTNLRKMKLFVVNMKAISVSFSHM